MDKIEFWSIVLLIGQRGHHHWWVEPDRPGPRIRPDGFSMAFIQIRLSHAGFKLLKK